MESQTTQPSVTFLNMSGDSTLTWDKSNEDVMLALIEKKMAEGYTFFILKPRAGGLLGNSKKPLTDISQARKAGSVTVPDALARNIALKLGDKDVNAVVEAGHASILSTAKNATMDTVRRAHSAVEAIAHQTVATRPIAGG